MFEIFMKLNQLHHLVAIVERGSLRAAARHLDVPQPVLTRSIGLLEKELNTILFTRETKGMVLTPKGHVFHARAGAIVHEAQRAKDEMAQLQGDERGTVVAALSIMPHVGMLPQALPLFRQRYPQVCLQLIEGLLPDVENKLRNGSIDFYLGAAPKTAPMPGLHTQGLMGNTRAVIGRKNHPLHRVRSLKALANADWAITSVDYNAEDDLDNLFAQYGLQAPRIALHARSALSMMVALASSDLLAMLPVQWAEFPLTQSALEVIKIREVLPAPPIVLIRRTDLPLTPAAGYFVDMLLRQLPKSVTI
jgi:LysR family transcriptional regulator of abg operon